MLFAVTALMIVTPILIGIMLLARKRPNPIHYWTCAAVLFFGGLTLLIGDPLYIMLKTTVVYTAIALALAIALILNKNPVAALFANKIPQIPLVAWRQVAWQWTGALLGIAMLNLVLIFTISEQAWVSIKTFGFPLILLVLTATQFGVLLRRHSSESTLD